MRNNLNTQEQYKISEGNNQLVLILNSEILLPEDAPVRVTSAQLEELDYRKLYEAYSSKGRKSATDPRVLFKVMAYGYQRGIYSTRKLEEACKYRVDFMWLLENGKAPDHATLSRFRTGRCAEAVDDPHGRPNPTGKETQDGSAKVAAKSLPPGGRWPKAG